MPQRDYTNLRARLAPAAQADRAARMAAAADAIWDEFRNQGVSWVGFYLPGAVEDTLESHAAALEYADGHLGRLFAGLRRRGPWLAVVCSDHGTAYGEDGYTGHRLAHPVVWDVPYAEFVLDGEVS